MTTAQPAKSTSKVQGFQLVVADDRLSVVLSCEPDFAASAEAIDAIRSELNDKGIKKSFEVEALNKALSDAASTQSGLSNFVLVQGIEPTPAQDARLEWSRDFFAKGYYVDPVTHLVDYHRRAASKAVAKDDVLAVVHPSQPGRNAEDVFGKILGTARPKELDVRAGQHVIWDEKAHNFRAECAGLVRLNGKLIEVLDVMQVSGDVGPESGNIDHGGSVQISGGVGSEFQVKALGDIEINDVVGAADIECGGDLHAKKGIRSAAGKKIVVKGSVHAKYIEQGTIMADGDIVVEAEIVDSTIRTSGRLICNGRIQGGDAMAAGGIEVDEVGTRSETHTVLIAGVDYRMVNSLRDCTEKSKQIKDGLVKLKSERKRLSMLGTTMTHQQRERYTELEFNIYEANEMYGQLTEQRKKLAVQMAAHKDAQIIIRKCLNPGTVLRVLDSQMEVQDALIGPIAACLDPIARTLALSSIDSGTKE
jgi:uncharacterized protein (DUF342 family)